MPNCVKQMLVGKEMLTKTKFCQIGNNIGRVGDTVATDSVVMGESIQHDALSFPLEVAATENEQEE